MKQEIIIAVKNKDLHVFFHLNEMECGEGQYRVITKCQAGFMISSVVKAKSPVAAFRQYKPKAIQSIAFIKPMKDGSTFDFTVFARNGKKIWASEEFLRDVEVGDINQSLYNTALYNQYQYQAVNAKSWASKAYVMNEVKEMVA